MRARGFTLVELVISLVIMAILAVAVSNYLGLGARMYADVAEREQILGQSRFVAERLVRELRNAAPNSVRVNDVAGLSSCIEFIPVAASGVYRRLPVAPQSSNELQLELFNWNTSLLAQQLIVYPTTPAHYYAASDRRFSLQGASVTNVAAITNPEQGASVELALATAYSFATDSPERRFYILQTSVSYCARDGEIRRLVGYDFSAGNPPAGAGVLMAQQVKSALFQVQPAVLTRNAVVNMFMQFGSDSSSDMFFNYEVHLPNVP